MAYLLFKEEVYLFLFTSEMEYLLLFTEEAYLFVPCPMSSITKMMAESVAKNFQLLFDYVYDDSR